MKDIFTSYLAQAVGLLANFASGVLVARLLLPMGRGELGQVVLWPTLIASLGGLSIGDAIIYFVAGRRSEAPRVIASAYALGGILSLALMICGYAALPYLMAGLNPEVERTAGLYLLFIPLGYASFYAVCALQGLHRFELWNLLRVLVSCVYTVFAALLWLTDEISVMSFTAAALIANLSVFAVGMYLLRRVGALDLRPRLDLTKELLAYGAKLHVANMLALANQRIDQILVMRWLLSAQFGYYLVAIAINNSAMTLVILLGSLLFPKVAAAESDAARAEAMGPYLRLALVLSLGGGCLLFLLAPTIVTLIYGEAYHPAASAVQVFAIGTAPGACKSLLAQTFKAVGRPRVIILAEFVDLVVTALCLVLLVKPLGIVGAAAAMMLGQAFGFVVLALAVRRELGLALLPLFTPSARDVSTIMRRLRDLRARG